jgi:hypothetical protein
MTLLKNDGHTFFFLKNIFDRKNEYARILEIFKKGTLYTITFWKFCSYTINFLKIFWATNRICSYHWNLLKRYAVDHNDQKKFRSYTNLFWKIIFSEKSNMLVWLKFTQKVRKRPWHFFLKKKCSYSISLLKNIIHRKCLKLFGEVSYLP